MALQSLMAPAAVGLSSVMCCRSVDACDSSVTTLTQACVIHRLVLSLRRYAADNIAGPQSRDMSHISGRPSADVRGVASNARSHSAVQTRSVPELQVSLPLDRRGETIVQIDDEKKSVSEDEGVA